ncbi:hypothetical protein [Massilia sp. 9096]|uniref:hypothetical protein n=1 Tax=Massilia sp. 9096 TaxID=1500894 RepID=UPI00055B24F8|nr:hypothetical protein [Massilia sp. 9096]
MIATAYPLLKVFDRLLPPAVRAHDTELQGARQLSLLAAVTAGSVPLLTVMYHLLGYDAVGMMVITAGIVMMVSPFTLTAGAGLPLARDLFVGALFMLKIGMALQLGGIGAPTTPWFVLCPAVAMLIGGLRPGLVWGALVLVALVALFVLQHLGALPPAPVDPDGMAVLQLAGMIGLLALVALIVALAMGAAATRGR